MAAAAKDGFRRPTSEQVLPVIAAGAACYRLGGEVGSAVRGSLRAHRHAEDPAVFTRDPHVSRRNVENMGLHYVHPQKAPTNGENEFEF